jgi:hypothetical protein
MMRYELQDYHLILAVYCRYVSDNNSDLSGSLQIFQRQPRTWATEREGLFYQSLSLHRYCGHCVFPRRQPCLHKWLKTCTALQVWLVPNLHMSQSKSSVRMDQHLRVPLNPLVELLIRSRGLVDAHVMGHDEAGLGPARDDQITEITVIRFDIALACRQRQSLLNFRPSAKYSRQQF